MFICTNLKTDHISLLRHRSAGVILYRRTVFCFSYLSAVLIDRPAQGLIRGESLYALNTQIALTQVCFDVTSCEKSPNCSLLHVTNDRIPRLIVGISLLFPLPNS